MGRKLFFLGVVGVLSGMSACSAGDLHREDIDTIRQLVSEHKADVHRATGAEDALHTTAQYLETCLDTLESMGAVSCHMMSSIEMTGHMSSLRGVLEQHGDAMAHAASLDQMAAQVDHHVGQMGPALDRLQAAHGGGHGHGSMHP